MLLLGPARTDARPMRSASALARTGLDVTIVDIEHDEDRPRREELDGAHLKHLHMRSWFTSTRFKPFFLVKALGMLVMSTGALLRTPADVYHAHDYIALLPVAIVARLRRKPFIFDAHEMPLVDQAVTRWPRLVAICASLLRRIVSRCAGVIVVSPPIGDEIQRRFGGPPPTLVRNTPAYQPPTGSNRLRERLGLDRSTRIALYQGYLQPDRSLDILVRAARFLATGHVIVLMGRGTAQAELEALATREGVTDRLFLLPHVPYQELLSWTSSADLGLCIFRPDYSLSIRWCLPNKLFEYLMAGVPVLSSNLDAAADLLTHYDVGQIVSSLEPEPIGREISRMLADHDALAGMRMRAIAAARELCWERERDHLIGLYEQILGQPLALVEVEAPAVALTNSDISTARE